MDIAVEISLYPLNQDFIPPIQDFIDRLNAHPGLRVTTNHLSTQVFGDHDRIFEVLRREMGASFAAGGKAIFVTKFIGPYQLSDAEHLLQRLLEGLRATPLAEWVAVAAGLIYVLLIMARHRAGWIFGGVSSLILMVMAARAHLPMNALLQFSYVVAAVYGWWSWSRAKQGRPIGVWHWRGHAIALAGCMLLGLGLSQLPAMALTSAFPFTDSLVACVGLVATWLVARVYVENWLYWILVDAVSIYLYFSQGLVASSFLYVMYLVIATIGFFHWRAKYRRQIPAP